MTQENHYWNRRFRYTQTEDLTMGNAGAVTSSKTFKTVSSIAVDGSGTAGTLSVALLKLD